ncbi:MAG: hypothetical protein H6577_05840 [Lewinellaceae bacterium]|nr:hypothetical protein [Saprospiraceae bacterium]MCB9337628.1 hypothetical protein [Lewinellaceae bacterium]
MGRSTSIIQRLPHFYQSEEVLNLFYQFVEAFGHACDVAEEDLLRVMRSHWVDSADNSLPAGVVNATAAKGDLDKIFTLYIERLGVTSLLQQGARRPGEEGKLDDEVYRTRIKGLINVLRSGASTKENIVKIVGANLGIVDDADGAAEALGKIQIVEYLPEKATLPTVDTVLYEPFTLINPNVVPTPTEFRLKVREDLPYPLTGPALVNFTSGEKVQYNGTVKAGDVLSFFPGKKVMRNGEEFVPDGQTPLMLPGENILRLEAEVGLVKGKFDEGIFDFSTFASENADAVGIFNNPGAVFDLATFDFAGELTNKVARFDEEGVYFDLAVFAFPDPVASLEAKFTRLHPATFMVRIPWDIPSFTVNLKVTDLVLERLEATGLPPEILAKLETVNGQEIGTEKEFFEKAGLTETEQDEHKALILSQLEYPDKFSNLPINPRSQIKPIVDKVRAAGVYAVVDYVKNFTERHDMTDQIAGLQIAGTQEDQQMEEANFDIGSVQTPYPDGLEHEMSDSLLLAGVFDYTGFDSLNSFA